MREKKPGNSLSFSLSLFLSFSPSPSPPLSLSLSLSPFLSLSLSHLYNPIHLFNFDKIKFDLLYRIDDHWWVSSAISVMIDM